MVYCQKCGTKARLDDTFCGECGIKIGESAEEAPEQTEKIVRKKGSKGFTFLIIILLIGGYVVLDYWAVAQLRPALSLDSILNSAANFDGDIGLTSASASTTIRIENPTFVPVFFGRVIYDAGYGSTKVAEGKTGIVFVGPYSTQDLPADIRVSYIEAGVAGLKAIKNLAFGGSDKPNANVYADF